MKILPENDYQILRLTDCFYKDYPIKEYKELMMKRKRAYNCLLFQTHYEYFICIPYRTEITHENAFLFKKSKRSRKHKSGLDYSKIIIISKLKYLENEQAIIDQDEFRETMMNLERIKKDALKFVEDYIHHINGTKILHSAEFKRKYQYTTLKYFHDEIVKI